MRRGLTSIPVSASLFLTLKTAHTLHGSITMQGRSHDKYNEIIMDLAGMKGLLVIFGFYRDFAYLR